LSLVASLAAFGCTTNSMRGAGDPWTGSPGVGPSSPAATSGTSVPTTPPPMTSSYTREDAQPAKPMRSHMLPLSAAEAAAIMAQHQPRVRVLGPSNPGPAIRPYVSDGLVTGQVVSPPVIPQFTINSSINNPQPGSAITSGVGAGGVTSDAGAAVFTQNLNTLTPTVLGAAVPPTTAVVTSGGAVATTTTNAATVPTTVAAASTNRAIVSTGTGTVSANTARAATNGNVRVVTTSGKVVVTNVKSQ
jgi:hypothetical protein